MNRVIVVISGGALQAVYANEDIDVELLDEDNGKVDEATHKQNQELQKETKSMKSVW